jgi:short-subunit dehydrogenase
MRIEGAMAVVTGASSGIGEETAIRLAKRGARVLAVARSEASLRQLADENPGITPFVADVTDADARAAVVDAAGEVDLLVNNAGLGWTGLVEDMPADAVRQLFEVNVLALIDLTQRALPGMLERRRGHVINVASVASWMATPPITVYSATKYAVQGFSEGLRRELLGRGVAVTTINPGPVATRFGVRAEGDRPTELLRDERMPGVPASMVADEIVRAVRLDGMPPYDVVAVPRALGASRMASLPGASHFLDAASIVARRIAPRRMP